MTRVRNAAGDEFELKAGVWVPVAVAQAPQGAPGGGAGAQTEAPKLTTGPINAAMIGAGDVFNTVGLNARELWNKASGDIEGLAQVQEDRAEAAQRRAALQAEAPIASRVGGALPALATLPLGMGAGAGAGLTRAVLGTGGQLGRIAESVGLGALTGGATDAEGDVLGGGAAGGALGGAGAMAGQMAARVIAGRQAAKAAREAGGMGPGQLTGGEQDILAAAQRAGMAVTPGQAVGSKQMRQLEAGMASNPWTARPFVEIDDANKLRLNTLAAKAIGQEADNVGPAVRGEAAEAIGAQFREVGRKMGPVDVKPLKAALQNIEAEESTAVLPLLEVKSLLRRFGEGEAGRVAAAGGEDASTVTGAALMRERSRISKQMRDAFAANNSDKGELYGRVLDAIDDTARSALVNNLGKRGADEAAALYDTARDQWNVLRALDRGGASMDGNVLAGQAARLVGQGDKTRFLRGGLKGTGTPGEAPLGDFYDALRFSSSQLGRPIVGDSGTATRSAVTSILQGGSLTGTVAGGARNLLLSPVFRAYARSDPQAARMAAAVASGMGQSQARAGSIGGAVARPGSAWNELRGE